jgi:hypothetical protein
MLDELLREHALEGKRAEQDVLHRKEHKSVSGSCKGETGVG